jgi:hypothetical protein
MKKASFEDMGVDIPDNDREILEYLYVTERKRQLRLFSWSTVVLCGCGIAVAVASIVSIFLA